MDGLGCRSRLKYFPQYRQRLVHFTARDSCSLAFFFDVENIFIKSMSGMSPRPRRLTMVVCERVTGAMMGTIDGNRCCLAMVVLLTALSS